MLLSAADLDSLEATLELLADEAAMARLRETETPVAAGNVTGAEEMSDLMARRRERERRARMSRNSHTASPSPRQRAAH